MLLFCVGNSIVCLYNIIYSSVIDMQQCFVIGFGDTVVLTHREQLENMDQKDVT